MPVNFTWMVPDQSLRRPHAVNRLAAAAAAAKNPTSLVGCAKPMLQTSNVIDKSYNPG